MKCLTLCFLALCLIGLASPSIAYESGKDASPPPSSNDFEDAAETLTPARPRSSLEQDRIQALAFFASARTYEQQEEYATALKLYGKALRLAPDSLPILRQLVQVGMLHHERSTEVLPYALRLLERDPSFAPQLRKLSQTLIERGDLSAALGLLKTSLSVEPVDKHTARYVLLRTEIGRLSFLTDDFAAAADSFDEVIAALEAPEEYRLNSEIVKAILDPPSLTWNMFGEAFLRVERAEAAIDAFRKAFHEARQKPQLSYHLARAHLLTGEAALALSELEEFLNAGEATEGSGPYQLLGRILEALGRSDDVIPRLERLREKSAVNSELGLFLAARYKDAGQTDKAITLYEEILRDSSEKAGYGELIGLYRLAGDHSKLMRTLARYVAETGELASLGVEAQELGKDEHALSRTVLAAAQAVERDTPAEFDYGLRVLSALLAIAIQDFDLAGQYYHLAISDKPDNAAELYLGWGVALLIADKYAQAAAVFQQAIDKKALPDENPLFHYYLSSALEMAGRTAEAIIVADQAIKSMPDSPRLYSRLAWIYYHSKQYADAAQAYEDMIDKFAGASVASAEVRKLLREARLALSNLCVLQKNMPAAESWLEQILDAEPDDSTALNDLAYLWVDQGKHLERALIMSRQAIAAEPENAAFQDTLGWVLFRLGKFDEALPHMQRATEGEKIDGVVLDHLADVHQALGQTEQAVAAWKKALERYDATDDAYRIEQTRHKLEKAGAE